MLDKTALLTDAQMRFFIVNGYVTVKTDLPPEFHRAVFEQTAAVFEKEGNPGNNLLPRIPAVRQVFDSRAVQGALRSILGEDYYMQPHRHCHYNQPASQGQNMHQDGGKRWSHLTRWMLAFYYPQDTFQELGPTGILPGSHYYNTPDSARINEELPLCGEAGTVTIAHYDLWHRAMPNRSEKRRYMMKFLFARMSEPRSPSWNHAQAGPWQSDQRMFQHVWNWHCGQTNGGMSQASRSGAGCISKLMEALESDWEPTGLHAAYALSGLGAPAVPGLIERLGNESEAICRNTCYALSAMGTPAVGALIGALRDGDWRIRDRAAETLGDMGLPARAALPALMQAMQDESEEVRSHAAEALGTVGQLEPTTAPALISGLRDEHGCVRRNAALALARLGAHARDAVDALQAVLFDEDRYVRGDAAHALHRIGTPEARGVLLRFLTTSRWCPLTTPDSTF